MPISAKAHLTIMDTSQIQNKVKGIQLGILLVLESLTAAIQTNANNINTKILLIKVRFMISIYILSGAETPSKLKVSSKQILVASQRASLAL